MIGIHLTAWAGLFIWYFRMRKKKENRKLVRRVFFLAATGFLIGTALSLPIGAHTVSGDRKAELRLKRGALGSQPTEENLEVSVENGERHRITLSVPAMEYSKKEIQAAFAAVENNLDTIILGENSSFSSVNRNMELVTEVPDSPVEISWSTDKPLLIDSRGLLSDEIPEEGEEVTLEAELRLQGETKTYLRKVVVFPTVEEGDEALEKELIKAVEEENKNRSGEEDYLLPQTLEEKQLTWSRVPDQTGTKVVLLSVLTAVLAWAGEMQNREKKKKEKEQQMLKDYPDLISKMVLLLGAGLGMRNVLERMVEDDQKRVLRGGDRRYAYEELAITCYEMENGIPEQEAYQRLGMRCNLGVYRSLSVLLTQNLRKGSKGLLELLKQESQEAFEERRRQARTAGETASTKLLLPMGMMLSVVLVILTVPAFLSFYA